jgi:ankyrin repeat protein
MWLPPDDARATEIAEMLLAGGADPTVRNKQGQTAADLASLRGLDGVAALLRSRQG